jgi:microcystin degradation protein MlrC
MRSIDQHPVVSDGGPVAYDDCEGDVIEHVRAIVGPNVPIGVELDPHCHLTEKRVRLADAVILYKEYPHIDFVERAEELVTIILGTIRARSSR